MFVIQWIYALANIVVALLLFLYIGKTSPGLPLGDFHHLISCLETLSLASWWGAVRVDKCPEFCSSFVLYTTCTCAAPSSLVCQSELWTWDAFGCSHSVVSKCEAFCKFTRTEQYGPKIIQYCRVYTGYRVYVWIKSRCSCWALPCDFFCLSSYSTGCFCLMWWNKFVELAPFAATILKTILNLKTGHGFVDNIASNKNCIFCFIYCVWLDVSHFCPFLFILQILEKQICSTNYRKKVWNAWRTTKQ